MPLAAPTETSPHAADIATEVHRLPPPVVGAATPLRLPCPPADLLRGAVRHGSPPQVDRAKRTPTTPQASTRTRGPSPTRCETTCLPRNAPTCCSVHSASLGTTFRRPLTRGRREHPSASEIHPRRSEGPAVKVRAQRAAFTAGRSGGSGRRPGEQTSEASPTRALAVHRPKVDP